jgi:hypothetical protein
MSSKQNVTPPNDSPADRRARREQLVQDRRKDRVSVKERQQRQRLINFGAIGATALVVVLIVGIVGVGWWNDRQGAQALEDVQTYSYQAAVHQDGELTYTEVPPVGGTHNNVWQTCGFYPGVVPNWHAVHSLEHGAIWITYSPDLPQDQVDQLEDLATSQSYILVSMYPGLSSPIVASAWNQQLALDSVDDPGLDAFIEEFKESPTNTPEYGARCDGGNTGVLPV